MDISCDSREKFYSLLISLSLLIFLTNLNDSFYLKDAAEVKKIMNFIAFN